MDGKNLIDKSRIGEQSSMILPHFYQASRSSSLDKIRPLKNAATN